MTDESLRVVYVVGMGRSGSTLLDRVLGREQGVVSLGEASNIWRNGVIEGRNCACGEPFERCDFWTEVAQRAAPALSHQAAEQVVAVHSRHLDTRRMWTMLTASTRRQVAADLPAAYLANLGAVYRAVVEVAGASTLVDSSKHPAFGYFLSLVPGLRVDFVHLVRDPRAVAYSWSRSRIEPGTNPPSLMHQYSATESGILYNLYNLAARRVATRGAGSYSLLRYEDFVQDPERALHQILPGRPKSPTSNSREERVVDVAVNHALSGNPMRFSGPKTVVSVDDEWRTGMAARHRRVVELLTMPVALRYRYLPTTRLRPFTRFVRAATWR